MPAPGSIAALGQNNTLALVSFITAIAAPFGHLVGVVSIQDPSYSQVPALCQLFTRTMRSHE